MLILSGHIDHQCERTIHVTQHRKRIKESKYNVHPETCEPPFEVAVYKYLWENTVTQTNQNGVTS